MTETQINQTIGQLVASINKIEEFINDEEFKDYCDAITTAVTYWRVIKKSKKII